MNTIELLNVVLANRIADMHIALPAKITKYDYKKQKASVKPSINQKYNDGEVVELPEIHNVPVMHPASGGASITFPVLVGDNVYLLFCEKSLEEFLTNGQINTPDDPRQNNLTDAVAFIGLNPFSKTSPAENNTDLLINFSGSKIKLKPDGIVDIETAELNITAPAVNVESDDVVISGNLTAANVEAIGELKSATAAIGGRDFATHTHSGVTTGPGTTGPVS